MTPCKTSSVLPSLEQKLKPDCSSFKSRCQITRPKPAAFGDDGEKKKRKKDREIQLHIFFAYFKVF